jgi:hypothetical protein
MRQLFIAILSLVSTNLPAQTKKIAFESHSGNLENFNTALTDELFDNGESDYGLPANKKAYKLDSVIFVSDSVSIMVSKEYSRPWSATSDSMDKFVGLKKDTIYNDPLFSRKYLIDSVKKMIDNRGLYETTNKTKFVGFDNKKGVVKKPGDKQQQLIPITITNDPPDNHSPFDMQLTLILGLILLLSLLGGWMSWKFYQPRLQQRMA